MLDTVLMVIGIITVIALVVLGVAAWLASQVTPPMSSQFDIMRIRREADWKIEQHSQAIRQAMWEAVRQEQRRGSSS